MAGRLIDGGAVPLRLLFQKNLCVEKNISPAGDSPPFSYKKL